ncbi:nitrogen fixation protein NifW [Affinibrenneria salicis]|uniref:Nitrogenase-stabilizing/protective protein NifW n=1 Tax=Affinibrenneria salicis TaxID=2590031 RepID=A0A5J5FTL0_9GAMM|nr:nitrogenase-stabilizing/protective protein NifW [Affinibrenneria salicis]KAA8996874.1 nitrogen fixation protein NifW [Affinibrenneria salicis]
MEWFYRLPGVAALDSAESFFIFFAVPYDADLLRRRQLLVLLTFRQRLAACIPLRNGLEQQTDADWQRARRLLAESYQQSVADAATAGDGR